MQWDCFLKTEERPTGMVKMNHRVNVLEKTREKNYVRKANELFEEAELHDNCVGSSL